MNNHVKFINYTGEFPNLCDGVLTLEIDGKEVKFGNGGYNVVTKKYNKYNKSFWTPGGGFKNNGYSYTGKWVIDIEDIPKQYRKYAKEIDNIVNSNMKYGCCGGCVR